MQIIPTSHYRHLQYQEGHYKLCCIKFKKILRFANIIQLVLSDKCNNNNTMLNFLYYIETFENNFTNPTNHSLSKINFTYLNNCFFLDNEMTKTKKKNSLYKNIKFRLRISLWKTLNSCLSTWFSTVTQQPQCRERILGTISFHWDIKFPNDWTTRMNCQGF